MNIQTTVRPATPKALPKTEQGQEGQQPDPQNPKGPTDFLTTSVEILKDTGMFVANELREAGSNDPALGLRLAANRFDAEFLDGTGDLSEGFSGMAVAFVRGGLLGANVYRANKTFKNPESKPYQKALDIGRIATDLIGLTGAVMSIAVPSMADTGRILTQVSYGADLVSHSIRSLEHGGKRINFLSEARAASKRPQE